MVVLVVAPHADDEVLGVGGTIRKHVNDGDEVYVVIATDASKGAPELFNQASIEKSRGEALQAHDKLGVSRTFFLDLPAPKLNAYPSYKISNALSKVFNEVQPETVYLPHPGDLHEDHKAIYRASLVCIRPQGTYSVKRVLCYETLSETDWTPHIGDFRFKPNYFVDISNEIEAKLEAMKCFNSQLKEYPHPRSLMALNSLSNLRGTTVSKTAVEAFEVERIIVD